jgi:hypothetical protein
LHLNRVNRRENKSSREYRKTVPPAFLFSAIKFMFAGTLMRRFHHDGTEVFWDVKVLFG